MSNETFVMVNGIKFSVCLPAELIEAVEENFKTGDVIELSDWKSKGVQQSLRYAIPKPVLPSTISQIRFVEYIAKVLELDVPREVKQSKGCRDFIKKHKPAFEEKLELQNRLKYSISKAVRTRRLIEAKTLVDEGKTLVEVAIQMKVKQTETIQKYLDELAMWESATAGTDEHKVVIKLIKELELGVDLHKKYLPYP